MAFDESLAARIRDALADHRGVVEKNMFGGLAFLRHGHMCCGVLGDRLLLRLGADGAAAALREPHTSPMDFTGKPIRSMIYVDPGGTESDAALRDWVGRAVEFAATLPPTV